MAFQNDLWFPFDNNNADYCTTLLKTLYEAALIGDDTDVVLVFGKFDNDDDNAPKLHVHSTILKTGSSVFKTWMSDNESSNSNRQFIKSADGRTMISLPADDPEEFKSFLKLMYGQKGLTKKNEMHTMSIPAFKIADKYGALGVMKVCEEDFLPVLFRNLANSNVAQVYDFAQKYGKISLTDSVLEFVKKNPMEALVEGKYASDWIMNGFGEEVLIRLLSTDSYRVPSEHDWSGNEYYLCKLASRWLRNRMYLAQGGDYEEEDEDSDDEDSEDETSEDEDEEVEGNDDVAKGEDVESEEDAEEDPSSPICMRVETSTTAVRVLQNIRFLQMSAVHLKACFLDLKDLLTPHEIGTICLICSGVSQDDIKSPREGEQFIVNTELREK